MRHLKRKKVNENIVAGLGAYWIISHIIGTVRFLRNEDYSYKFSMDILKP